MAPGKRKATEGVEEDGKPKTTTLASTTTRVTRSMARLGNSGGVAPPAKPANKKQKGKATKEKKKVKEESAAKAEEEETKLEAGPTDAMEEAEEDEQQEEEKKKTIVVEHCKQCNSFKTRAIQVKDGLERAVPGVAVLLNPEKPRRGCFEIREEGGKKFISLLDMKRPFTPMKNLDMEQVIADIVDKIKA